MKKQFLLSVPARRQLQTEKRALLKWFFYGPIAALIVCGFDVSSPLEYFPYGPVVGPIIRDAIHSYTEGDGPEIDNREEPSSPVVPVYLLPHDELATFYSKEDQERIRETRRQKHQKMMDEYHRHRFYIYSLRQEGRRPTQ